MEKFLLNDILDRLDYIESYLCNQKKTSEEDAFSGCKKYVFSGSYDLQNGTEIALGQVVDVGCPVYIICKVVASENAVLQIKCGANTIGCGNVVKNDNGMLHIWAGFPEQNGTISLSLNDENKIIKVSNIILLFAGEFVVA